MPEPSILPPGATAFDRAVEAAVRLPAALDGDLRRAGRSDLAELRFLPWLAWALSVDVWDDEWPEARKRGVIAASVEVHRRKGTVGSVRRAVQAAGYATATIEEFADAPRIGADGNWGIGETFEVGFWPGSWADYRVVLSEPITTRQVATLEALLASVAPVRCRLRQVVTDIFFSIGDGLWSVGTDIAIGGSYPLGAE